MSMFCTVPATNCESMPKHYELIGICNGDGPDMRWGRKRMLRSDIQDVLEINNSFYRCNIRNSCRYSIRLEVYSKTSAFRGYTAANFYQIWPDAKNSEPKQATLEKVRASYMDRTANMCLRNEEICGKRVNHRVLLSLNWALLNGRHHRSLCSNDVVRSTASSPVITNSVVPSHSKLWLKSKLRRNAFNFVIPCMFMIENYIIYCHAHLSNSPQFNSQW